MDKIDPDKYDVMLIESIVKSIDEIIEAGTLFDKIVPDDPIISCIIALSHMSLGLIQAAVDDIDVAVLLASIVADGMKNVAIECKTIQNKKR